jgi:hypothetical protein
MSRGETVVVKEFPPEQAGEIVSWANVAEKPDNELVVASIALARISQTGARYSYQLVDNERQVWSGSVKGFEDSTELTVKGRSGKVVDLAPTKAPGIKRVTTSKRPANTGFANSFFADSGDAASDGWWTVGSTDILDELRFNLHRSQADWLYPPIYYHLAQMVKDDMLLADANMFDSTAVEIEAMTSHLGNLGRVQYADEAMLRDLSVFGLTPAAEISDRYAASRLHVTSFQQRASKVLDGFISPAWIPKTKDLAPRLDNEILDANQIANTAEYQALQNADVRPAVNSLESELQAVDKRREAVRPILGRLVELASKEYDLALQ